MTGRAGSDAKSRPLAFRLAQLYDGRREWWGNWSAVMTYTPHRSPSLGTVVALVIMIVGVVALASGAGVLAFRLSERTGGWAVGDSDKTEMTKDRMELLIAANRSNIAGEEHIFWVRNGIDSRFLPKLETERNAAHEKIIQLDEKAKNRWGKNLKGLRTLNPERADRYEALVSDTKRFAGIVLSGYEKALTADIEKSKTQLRVDIPLKLSEIPFIDRSTAQGKLAYEEEELLRPARDALARAQREEEIAKRHVQQIPSIIQKWVKVAHDEIQSRLEECELEFRK